LQPLLASFDLKIVNILGDFQLPPRSRWELFLSGLLCSE